MKIHGSFQPAKKVRLAFCVSCGSTHKIEFAKQIHKFREHGPDHPLLPLCGNSPCVSRNLYKGRKNVSAGRGFSSRFARKRGFEREAVRKTKFFDSLRDILKSMSLFHTRNKRRNSKDYENISQTSLSLDCTGGLF